MADSALSWNKFVIENSSPSSFLQAWEWGEFQQNLGTKILRLEGAAWKAQAVVRKLPVSSSYLEIAKGPIIDSAISDKRLAIGELAEKIKEIGKREKAVLARINPPYERVKLDLNEEWRKPAILVRQLEPENTVLVDLFRSEDELLSNMHEKSRYNLRLAVKKGVKVEIATDSDEAFEQFLALLKETAKRDGFLRFRQIFMTSSAEPRAELLIGSLNGRVLAAAIVMLFGDSGTYLYAASPA